MAFGANWWSVRDHRIVVNNTQPFQILGINWFGFETLCNTVHGLWVHPLNYYLDFLNSHGITSIRVPLSYELASNLDVIQSLPACVTQEPRFLNTNARDMLHILFFETKRRGITILLDFHSINGIIPEFPWTDTINEDMIFQMWSNLIGEYKQYWNLIGIDIKNEPHGAITWAVWKPYVQRFISRVRQEHPDFDALFFVGGIQDPYDGSGWGGSFSGMGTPPLDDAQIVFAPHVYGPSVRGSYAAADSSTTWDTWFGFMRWLYPNPIVIGEMGGIDFGEDAVWHDAILQYLLRTDIRNLYYWVLNPNSIDTRGLLFVDWTTPNLNKLAFLDKLKYD